VGFMARYGSKAIRGHGIPEAMEQVLTNESKIKPAITFLKPVSSAFSIGTGGPFGAEGPIIATGGAFGSMIGQLLRTTPDERKILLTAGATAGMASIFGSPVAAVLLAIELLLFEFSPRSVIPVALACFTGASMHWILSGSGPFFAMPAVAVSTGWSFPAYIILGALMGVASGFATWLVYGIEDAFEKLPVHWMWWPAIGGLVVGIIGYFAPITMGVGYDNIKTILSGNATISVLLILCILKFASWAVALGSGTSGGTLAPLFTIGGALGALIGIGAQYMFPQLGVDVRVAALIGMAAIFAGASRALLTSLVFAFETTQQPNAILPLLGGCTVAYLVSFFMMKHSIMTEKIERRGVKTPSAYVPEILDTVVVDDIAEKDIHVLSAENTIQSVKKWIASGKAGPLQSSFPVVKDNGDLAGIISLIDFYNFIGNESDILGTLITQHPVTIYADNILRIAVDTMVQQNLDIIPVVKREDPQKIVGIVTQKSIMRAYSRNGDDHNLKLRSISFKRGGIKIILLGRKLIKR
jgi:CIC family chloride channel protein